MPFGTSIRPMENFNTIDEKSHSINEDLDDCHRSSDTVPQDNLAIASSKEVLTKNFKRMPMPVGKETKVKTTTNFPISRTHKRRQYGLTDKAAPN